MLVVYKNVNIYKLFTYILAVSCPTRWYPSLNCLKLFLVRYEPSYRILFYTASSNAGLCRLGHMLFDLCNYATYLIFPCNYVEMRTSTTKVCVYLCTYLQ